MIYREPYIQSVREFYDFDLIKIITGIRRSGKSVILQQIITEIGQKTDNIISLNFEDKRVSANITDCNALIDSPLLTILLSLRSLNNGPCKCQE